MKKKIDLAKYYFSIMFRDITSIGGNTFSIFLIILFIFINILTSVELILNFIFVWIIVIAIRMIYFKERPDKENYFNFLTKIDASSFPSVHSSRIVYTLLVLMPFYQNTFILWFAGVITFLVCYSRIYLKKHYLVDVVFGIILGLISTLFIQWLM